MSNEATTCVEILRKAAQYGVMDCQCCPAYSVCPTGTAGWNNECMFDTAADLIESLSTELERVKRERDAAVEEPQTDHTYFALRPYAELRAPAEGITYIDPFTAPYYEPDIDRMIYGVAMYDRLLEPGEIAGSGLVSEPRD